ncbi:MAG: HAD hydrolase-like protein [Alphaproteobacteria bacterium]|nr:HAD hydrolase-like protein [Alphaproteobacteria bacterium]
MTAIFLDLDGTLIDPKEGITLSIQHALRELGADVPSQNELTWCIGPPLHDSFRVLLGERADIGAAVDLYRERYTDEGMFEADVYDGIGEMLDGLRDTGLPLYIATSKPHAYASTIADHFGLSHYVNGLYGAELDGSNSDKTDLLAHALAETGADPYKSVMIGDRMHDILGAQNNDIPSLGVLWGYADEGELHMAEADALAGDPEEVPEIASELLGLE